MSDWIVDVLSFQKIFSLCGLKGHIVEIRGGVTLVDGRTDEQRNVKIELEFWKQNSQFADSGHPGNPLFGCMAWRRTGRRL